MKRPRHLLFKYKKINSFVSFSCIVARYRLYIMTPFTVSTIYKAFRGATNKLCTVDRMIKVEVIIIYATILYGCVWLGTMEDGTDLRTQKSSRLHAAAPVRPPSSNHPRPTGTSGCCLPLIWFARHGEFALVAAPAQELAPERFHPAGREAGSQEPAILLYMVIIQF